jgi:hypothetical protein
MRPTGNILALARLSEYRDWETGSTWNPIMKKLNVLPGPVAPEGEVKLYIRRIYHRPVSSCPLMTRQVGSGPVTA